MIHLVQNQSTVHWKEPAQKNSSNQNLHNGTMGCREAHEHKSRKQNEIHNGKTQKIVGDKVNTTTITLTIPDKELNKTRGLNMLHGECNQG